MKVRNSCIPSDIISGDALPGYVIPSYPYLQLFEHGFAGEDARPEHKVTPAISGANELVESRTTVWNAKMVLMSGLSQNALEELSSERSYDDRIPHYCNMLRFAVLKRDNAFMAIGGPWDTVDGGDPSAGDSSLIQTVLRYAKDYTQLDLKNCRHWNRFLEIHYDRVGEDGLFSHKEVTVLFVPNLSDCLPSAEVWRDQWLAYKKSMAERETKLALKKESKEKKGGDKDKENESQRKEDNDKTEKKAESAAAGQATVEVNKLGKDDKEQKAKAAEAVKGEKPEKDDGLETSENIPNKEKPVKADIMETSEDAPNKEAGGSEGSAKTGKKKVIKKVIKQKLTTDKIPAGDSVKPSDNVEGNNVDQNLEISAPQPDESSAAVKTFVRKKVVKKVPAVEKESAGTTSQAELKTEAEGEHEQGGAVAAPVQDATVKKVAKKKIIKRVLKRKATSGSEEAKNGTGEDTTKDDSEAGVKAVQTGVSAPKDAVEAKLEENISSKSVTSTDKPLGNSTITQNKIDKEDKVEEKKGSEVSCREEKSKEKEKPHDEESKDQKGKPEVKKHQKGKDAEIEEKKGSEVSVREEKSKEKEKPHDEESKDQKGKAELKKYQKGKDEERKDQKGKDGSKIKAKEGKEKKLSDEPPRHPGLFLQTKGGKDSRLLSVTLSLDSLLDYTDKDIDESTFELSLFAESMHEMLHYQMGCRLLAFLQKLRLKFVKKRNQRKRQREEKSKEGEKKSSSKRLKTDAAMADDKCTKTETEDAAPADGGKAVVKVDEGNNAANGTENAKEEVETDVDEPEEDPEEEDQEMQDGSPQDLLNMENDTGEKMIVDANFEKEGENSDAKKQERSGENEESKSKKGSTSKEVEEKMEKKKKETVVVDKELLEAFRFFDRNRVGYIRVEDLRLIVHNLGKFLSHRDVKELVQSALLESNTGRDDRVLYPKLVRMADL